MAASGFYTDRIGYEEMLDLFRAAGFDIAMTRTERWDTLPTPVQAMSQPYASRSEDSLLVKGFDVVLRPYRH